MRIAIVGSGISGMTAAYLLQRQHEVTIFEAADQLGGHTYTRTVDDGGRQLAVDMGFIVYNERTYPLFCRLLEELKVATEESAMSFSVRSEVNGLEYNGSSIGQLFAQRRNILNPSFYRMLFGILRFHREADTLINAAPSLTLGDYLKAHGLTGPFVDDYLLPMTAAIWSTPPSRMFDFPARTLGAFLHNHGMLQVKDRPQWRVVSGGSQRYLDALVERFTGRLRLSAPVRDVRRLEDRVQIAHGRDASREVSDFDAVVLACHSDQALTMLGDPTSAESEVLALIPFRDNDVVLHTDRDVMPRARRAWASWNYHLTGRDDAPQMTYWMNLLQNLDSRTDTPTDYLVTLNRDELSEADTLHSTSMAHPQFGQRSDEAKARWSEISRERTFYCGAYWGYGFHEDGVKSGVRVAEALGVEW